MSDIKVKQLIFEKRYVACHKDDPEAEPLTKGGYYLYKKMIGVESVSRLVKYSIAKKIDCCGNDRFECSCSLSRDVLYVGRDINEGIEFCQRYHNELIRDEIEE